MGTFFQNSSSAVSETEHRESSQTPPIEIFSSEQKTSTAQNAAEFTENDAKSVESIENLDTTPTLADEITCDAAGVSNENFEKDCTGSYDPQLMGDLASSDNEAESQVERKIDANVVKVSIFSG